MKDFVRRSRSNTQATGSSDPPPTHIPLTSPRMSILPSVRIPLLRRHENEDPPANKKTSLLTLKLSSHSFLDSTVNCGASDQSLYEIKTSGTSTSILRTDPKHVFVKVASVKWPRVLPTHTIGKESTDVVLVQMRGSRWNGGESVLRPPTAPHAPRKFHIPNYSQSLKWKRYGTVYWCTTSSVKGPIAILETAKGSEPTKLSFYETLHDKYDLNVLSAFQGVSVLLLDYVLTTALLLVTDVQEWMLVQKYEGTSSEIPSLPSNAAGWSSSYKSLTSDPQLRKIMYGEPIYPKLSQQDLRSRESRSKHSSSSVSPTSPGPPRTPSSGMPYFGYEESEASSSRPPSPKHTLASVISSDHDYDDSFSMSDARSPSPLPESIQFSSATPSHTHVDPFFYGSPERPPVPPLPSRYRSHTSRIVAPSQPTTPISATSRTFRELPTFPIMETAPRPKTAPSDEPASLDSVIQHALHTPRAGRATSVKSFASNISQSSSAVRRPLPRPPPVPPISAVAPMVRRAQSSNHMRTEYRPVTAPSPARPQRSLPPTPLLVLPTDATSTPTNGTSTGSNTPLTPTQQQHSRQPPITKTSQEDLTKWVHLLTNPQRDLPPAPLPSTSIYDVPPPAYDTINFSNGSSRRRRPSARTAASNPR